MKILFLLILIMTTNSYSLDDEVIEESYKNVKLIYNLEYLDTCLIDTNPLTILFELDNKSEGRLSICASRPWRSNSWHIQECENICKEAKLENINEIESTMSDMNDAY